MQLSWRRAIPGPGSVVLVVLAPAALPLAYVLVVPHDSRAHSHFTIFKWTGLDPQVQRRPMRDGERLAVHFVGEDGLPVVRQLEV